MTFLKRNIVVHIINKYYTRTATKTRRYYKYYSIHANPYSPNIKYVNCDRTSFSDSSLKYLQLRFV